jgi:hypothetical protein
LIADALSEANSGDRASVWLDRAAIVQARPRGRQTPLNPAAVNDLNGIAQPAQFTSSASI